MSWRTLTDDDLVAYLSQREVAVYRASAGSDDVVRPTLEATTSLVRSYVRTAGVRLAAAENEIPASLVPPAIDYAVYDLLKRFRLPVGEDRRTARKDAMALFHDVASRRFSVEPADEVVDTAPAVTPMAGHVNPPRLLD